LPVHAFPNPLFFLPHRGDHRVWRKQRGFDAVITAMWLGERLRSMMKSKRREWLL